MKNYKVIIILLILIGCNEAHKKKSFKAKVNFDNFPKAWQRLTEINNELTLYFPCKGGDRSIQFSPLSNGNKLMHINYEEQYFDFLVKELNKKGDNHFLEVIDRKSNKLKVFRIENYEKQHNLAYWNWENNGKKHRYLFTTFDTISKYPVVHQPCKECPGTPCENIESIEGIYQVELPYTLSLDGGDYRELSFTIAKDSTSLLEIYYYPENENQEGESLKYNGKVKIDSIYFTVQFHNFSTELSKYFNPKKEPKLKYLNDSIFRFRKSVDGLIIDDSFCENWEMKKYKN
ncbi:hypothetical protein ABW636_12935 [Aquimarina sp. 2201CG1-2-11]|uniref:hypothetical protein n=1 Tax=Aquimarina discodermiae TaxID=3231043 RepID=UPI003463132B